MTHAERCPVCDGKGTVDLGFYDGDGPFDSGTSVAKEMCRSCSGRGYIVVPDFAPTNPPLTGSTTTAGKWSTR